MKKISDNPVAFENDLLSFLQLEVCICVGHPINSDGPNTNLIYYSPCFKNQDKFDFKLEGSTNEVAMKLCEVLGYEYEEESQIIWTHVQNKKFMAGLKLNTNAFIA